MGKKHFINSYRHSLDDKNRVNIPTRFRELASTKKGEVIFYLTLGFDRCLFLFDVAGWDAICRAMEQAEEWSSPQSWNLQRVFFASAVEVGCDCHGRILIPEDLKERAGIKREVMIVGVKNRIEIWDRSRWQELYETNVDNYLALACRVLRRREEVSAPAAPPLTVGPRDAARSSFDKLGMSEGRESDERGGRGGEDGVAVEMRT